MANEIILCRIFFRVGDLDAKIIPELYNNNTGKGFKLEEGYCMLDNRYRSELFLINE
jgi:hypothetical protein